MLVLARLADRGPAVAAGLAAGLLLLATVLPVLTMAASGVSILLVIASAAVVAYIVLRRGESSGFRVIGLCMLVLMVVSMVVYRSVVVVPLMVSIFWLPAILGAVVLKRTTHLGLAVLTLVGLGMLAVVGISVVTGDPAALWREPVAQLFEAGLPGTGNGIPADRLDELVEATASKMTGAFGVMVTLLGLLALFLARYWQAGMVNPGGFRAEFHALSLGRGAALFCLMLIALAVVSSSAILGGVASVALVAFVIQGLAVAHALVRQRGMNQGWLLGLYLVIMLPNAVLLVAALGLADNLYSLRKSENN